MRTVCFWSPCGENETKFSFEAGEKLGTKGKTLLIELPCLGIPRLGYVSANKDRMKNTEAAILRFVKDKEIFDDSFISGKGKLLLLPGSVYEEPDMPIVKRTASEELAQFVEELVKYGKSSKTDYLLFDLQGQLHSPMTFFALKKADRIYIHLPGPEELNYVVSVLLRLYRVYKVTMDNVVLICFGKDKLLQGFLEKIPELSHLRIMKKDVSSLLKEERKFYGI